MKFIPDYADEHSCFLASVEAREAVEKIVSTYPGISNMFSRVDVIDTAHSNMVRDLFRPMENAQDMLQHGAVGISGEAGELLDAVKKHVYYDKPLDVENVLEEAGDILFYVRAVLQVLGLTMEHAMAANIVKLGKRYPGGKFTTADAVNRADKAPGE